MIEHDEPGGVSCTTRKVLAADVVGILPPTELLVELLRHVDVGDRQHHHLESHVHELDSPLEIAVQHEARQVALCAAGSPCCSVAPLAPEVQERDDERPESVQATVAIPAQRAPPCSRASARLRPPVALEHVDEHPSLQVDRTVTSIVGCLAFALKNPICRCLTSSPLRPGPCPRQAVPLGRGGRHHRCPGDTEQACKRGDRARLPANDRARVTKGPSCETVTREVVGPGSPEWVAFPYVGPG